MNPHDELRSLVESFADNAGLIERADHIPSSETPEPYKQLLAHDHHMTVTMESFYQSQVSVEILKRNLDGDTYTRQILLRSIASQEVVQFGIVRFHLQFVTEAVRREILAGELPMGRVLINHNVLRHIDLGAILRITMGPQLAAVVGSEAGTITYGRLATIFCNQAPAVDLLEIASPASVGD